MPRQKKPKIEFRYYRMPPDSPILVLPGEGRAREHGRGTGSLHFHNYLEIGYCRAGEGVLVLGEREYRFREGIFTVIPRNFPHATHSDPQTASRWEYLFVDVEDLLRNFCQGGRQNRAERMIRDIRSGAVILTRQEYPKLAELLLGVLNVMREPREYYLEEARGGMTAFLAEVARRNGDGCGGPEDPGGEAVVPFARALDYIGLHYMEPLKIGQLADLCHISETHFRRMFSASMKMGPLEYVNLVRIRTACDRLCRTEESIGSVARKCGFATLSAFDRNFRRATGISPREWKKLPGHYEQQLLKFEVHTEEGR